MRWLRSSGSSHTTSRGTRSPRASACPGKLCLPSLRSVADTRSTGTKWHEPWRPSIPGNAGIESHLATEDSPSMLGSPPRSKIAPRTPGWFAGNPPQPKSTGWGLVSQGDTQFAAIPRLRQLQAQGAVAGDAGWAALSRSHTLEYIWGRDCPNFASRGFTALADLPSLRGLGISCKLVDDSALAALPRFGKWRQFVSIDVPDAGFR